ncbi:hypothetical protein [Actinacidiphila guanduensis]|uniref:hypothetical protein n=1 Tax=Actinacidiphila guanduensis TaxID=310781 RepID=UPI0038993377
MRGASATCPSTAWDTDFSYAACTAPRAPEMLGTTQSFLRAIGEARLFTPLRRPDRQWSRRSSARAVRGAGPARARASGRCGRRGPRPSRPACRPVRAGRRHRGRGRGRGGWWVG